MSNCPELNRENRNDSFGPATPQVGWYVWFVGKCPDDTWLFALNLDTRDAKDLPLRIRIAKDALRAKGALPSN